LVRVKGGGTASGSRIVALVFGSVAVSSFRALTILRK
jgi:hypothetical protein